MKNCIEKLGVVISTALLQKTALLEAAGILRKFVEKVFADKVCGKGVEERGGKVRR